MGASLREYSSQLEAGHTPEVPGRLQYHRGYTEQKQHLAEGSSIMAEMRLSYVGSLPLPPSAAAIPFDGEVAALKGKAPQGMKPLRVRWATAEVLNDVDPKKSDVATHTVEDVAEQLLAMLAATDARCKIESAGPVGAPANKGQL